MRNRVWQWIRKLSKHNISRRYCNIRETDNLFFELRDRSGLRSGGSFHNLVTNTYLNEFLKLIAGETQSTNLQIKRLAMFDTDGNSIIRRGFTTVLHYDNSVLVSAYFGELEGNPTTGNIAQIKFYCGDATDMAGTGTVLSTVNVDITKTEYHTLTIDYIITLTAVEG